jgi:hypothetical protein
MLPRPDPSAKITRRSINPALTHAPTLNYPTLISKKHHLLTSREKCGLGPLRRCGRMRNVPAAKGCGFLISYELRVASYELSLLGAFVFFDGVGGVDPGGVDEVAELDGAGGDALGREGFAFGGAGAGEGSRLFELVGFFYE